MKKSGNALIFPLDFPSNQLHEAKMKCNLISKKQVLLDWIEHKTGYYCTLRISSPYTHWEWVLAQQLLISPNKKNASSASRNWIAKWVPQRRDSIAFLQLVLFCFQRSLALESLDLCMASPNKWYWYHLVPLPCVQCSWSSQTWPGQVELQYVVIEVHQAVGDETIRALRRMFVAHLTHHLLHGMPLALAHAVADPFTLCLLPCGDHQPGARAWQVALQLAGLGSLGSLGCLGCLGLRSPWAPWAPWPPWPPWPPGAPWSWLGRLVWCSTAWGSRARGRNASPTSCILGWTQWAPHPKENESVRSKLPRWCNNCCL